MGETVRWAQNCLRIFELIKSVNGKGIHSGPIFQGRHQKDLDLKTSPKKPTIHKSNIFKMSVDVPDHAKTRKCGLL